MREKASKIIKAGVMLALVFFAVYGVRNIFLSSGVFLERQLPRAELKEKERLGAPSLGRLGKPGTSGVVSDLGEEFGAVDLEFEGGKGEEAPEAGASGRLVVKTGDLSILVKDTLGTVRGVGEVATSLGGLILSSRTWYADTVEERMVGEVVIKVPVEQFEEAMSRIRRLALKVTSEQSSGRDVTEEYVDLQSRLKNLRVAEAQLQKLMERAGKISEILEVQRELTRVRGEIERMEGRMKYLEQTAEMATVTVRVATEEEELPIVEEKWRPLAVVKAALRTLVRFWQSLADRVIYLGIFLAPWVVVGLVGWGVVRRRVKGKEQK